jgi:hypothetical protein
MARDAETRLERTWDGEFNSEGCIPARNIPQRWNRAEDSLSFDLPGWG